MHIEAHLKNLRISPRKASVVAKMLRGLSVDEASIQLKNELRRAALPLGKLLASAVANAEHNYHAVPSNLLVERVVVGEGMKLKRWMPRAQGRATPIWKRMSHVHITLKEIVPGMRIEDASKEKSIESKKVKVARRVKSKSFSDDLVSGKTKKNSEAHSSRVFHRKSV